MEAVERGIGLRESFLYFKDNCKNKYVYMLKGAVFWEKLGIEETKGDKWWSKFL